MVVYRQDRDLASAFVTFPCPKPRLWGSCAPLSVLRSRQLCWRSVPADPWTPRDCEAEDVLKCLSLLGMKAGRRETHFPLGTLCLFG